MTQLQKYLSKKKKIFTFIIGNNEVITTLCSIMHNYGFPWHCHAFKSQIEFILNLDEKLCNWQRFCWGWSFSNKLKLSASKWHGFINKCIKWGELLRKIILKNIFNSSIEQMKTIFLLFALPGFVISGWNQDRSLVRILTVISIFR